MRLSQTILQINLLLLNLVASEKVTVYPSSTSSPASDWITWPQSTNKIALTIQCSSYHLKMAFQMLEGDSIGMFEIISTNKDLLIHCKEGGARNWYDGNLLTFPTTSWGICSSGTSETLTIERTSVKLEIMKGGVVVFRRKWAADDGKCLLDAAMRLLQTILLINLLLLDLSSSEKVTVYPSSTSDPASDWITWPQSTNKIALTIQCSSYNPKVAFLMLEGGSVQGMFVIRSTYKDLLIHCKEGGTRDWNDGNLLTFPTTSWGICSSGTSETLTIERTSVIMKIMKGDVVVFRRKWAADDGKCLLDAEPCEEGTYRDSTTTLCVDCGAGKQSNSDKTGCEPCEEGTYRDSTTTLCVDCGTGKQSNSDKTGCEPCEEGAHRDSTTTLCVDCGAGKQSNSDKTGCEPCEEGTYRDSTTTLCVDCGAGKQSNSDKTGCEKCVSGTYKDSSMEGCAVCPGNTYSGEQAGICVTCPTGSRASQDHSSCESCGGLPESWTEMKTETQFPLQPGSEVSLKCSAGYTLTGDTMVTCVKGTLFSFNQPPLCSLDQCDGPPDTLHLATEESFPVQYGTVITVFCETGYLLSGDDTVTCIKNDTFRSLEPPSCSRKLCTSLPLEIAHLQSDAEFPVNYDAVISVYCNEGRELRGDALITCTHETEFNFQEKPHCNEIGTCSGLPVNLYTDTPLPIPRGVVVVVKCVPGFTLTSGDRRITCLQDDEFSAERGLPVCSVEECGTLPENIYNLATSKTLPVKHGTRLEVTCYYGYTLSGDNVITSVKDANWEFNIAPSCVLEQCRRLLTENFLYTNSSFPVLYGTMVTVACSQGYTLVGSHVVTCQQGIVYSHASRRPSCVKPGL
ncbi:hypothetical protein ACHWQZ_G003697 [Mnemiopsis leidyi]